MEDALFTPPGRKKCRNLLRLRESAQCSPFLFGLFFRSVQSFDAVRPLDNDCFVPEAVPSLQLAPAAAAAAVLLVMALILLLK
jgi:hypothetical protein